MRLILTNTFIIKRNLFLLILTLASISGQDDRLRLKQADVLENITIDGVSMQYLKGNVIFQKGEMTMNCDWARFNQRTEQGFLFGNVSMIEDVQNLTCDSRSFIFLNWIVGLLMEMPLLFRKNRPLKVIELNMLISPK